MAELIKVKQQLKKAKDSTVQSWLDSKPLIDELERLKSGLTSAEYRCKKSDIFISELQSQLEEINRSIRSKREEELRATEMINERNQAMDQIREEMERIKQDADSVRQSGRKLKQTLRTRRLTLRSLQLTLRAVRLETEAYSASAAEALQCTKCLEMENTPVQLTQEDYQALTKKAEDENSLAAWRISVSIEQKLAAETSRDIALTKLKALQSGKRLRNRELKKGKEVGREQEEGTSIRVEVEEQVNETIEVTPEAPAKSKAQSSQVKPRRQMKKSKGTKNKKVAAKKKTSIFLQIRQCLVRNIRKLFR
ncbi:hypothetical protein FNV43_RR17193 [Rhamnella rubrinervis]|uniref:Uncharacterized protein n=1 Tax=Rhamnella rubrinervis TaxID=2594499 RepID=A0A8K0E2R0_9ROSA|nr:hypothetical protein FNV43_RR17193 [Rhamnella rubrinervis]